MKRTVCLILNILVFFCAFSQNLVPNYSFEELWTCPQSFVGDAVKYPFPEWTNPNGGTPDAFHPCSEHEAGVPENFAGSIYPADGSAYAGIILWEKSKKEKKELYYVSREYLQTKLISQLKRNKLYCVKLRYANASKTMYSTDALGIAITKQKITAINRGNITQIPQVINKPGHLMKNFDYWEELCGTYRAKGNEIYLTIGNFYDNQNTYYEINDRNGLDSMMIYAYYFIDDVIVHEIENSFECACQNNLSYGSDRFADDYDPKTGYNSLIINDDIANSKNSGNDTDSDADSLIVNQQYLENDSANYLTENEDKNKLTQVTNLHKTLNLKTSEISDEAIKNAKAGDIFNLNMIFFEFNSWELLTVSYFELDALYEILIGNPNLRIEIRGHTDNIGSAQYNKTLSIKRAEAVYTYLLEKGISKSRMKYRGFGNKSPIADNKNEEGRSINRRVEFAIMEL